MASQSERFTSLLPKDIVDKYEVVSYRNAAQILATAAKKELADLVAVLRQFSLTIADIRKPGGNESDMPKKLAVILRPRGWLETRIKGDLHITKATKSSQSPPSTNETDETAEAEIETLESEELKQRGLKPDQIVRKNFLDGHKIDFVKNRVAFDVEWNSKDQTFDRDLYAFRAFHDCDLIDVAVVLTRGTDLNDVFDLLGPELDALGKPRVDKNGKPKLLKSKYGASTTWMGKLIYRLDAGRQGGCPVLAIGITRKAITDWKD